MIIRILIDIIGRKGKKGISMFEISGNGNINITWYSSLVMQPVSQCLPIKQTLLVFY